MKLLVQLGLTRQINQLQGIGLEAHSFLWYVAFQCEPL